MIYESIHRELEKIDALPINPSWIKDKIYKLCDCEEGCSCEKYSIEDFSCAIRNMSGVSFSPPR